MEEEGVESRKSRKEQERERRRLRDRERRQSMSQDERERHLARRRKNYQLRRQRAEINRLDSQIQAITGAPLTTSSPSDFGTSSLLLLDSEEAGYHTEASPTTTLNTSVGMIQLEELAKLMGTIRLSRLKHVARTLNKSRTGGVEASNKGESTRCVMSSGLRLSRVKRLVRSKGSFHIHPQSQAGLQQDQSSLPLEQEESR